MNVTTLSTAAYARTASAPTPAQAAAPVVKAAGQDLNSATMFTPTYSSIDSAEYKLAYEQNVAHVSAPALAADDSIKTIEDRLQKFQKNLALARPDLAKSDWDVTVKDGMLKVTGDIDPDDKRYMEARLNNDQALVGAVQSYMGAAVSYLETTEGNPAYTAKNGSTGASTLYNFKDVGKQLEGKIAFKELIAASWVKYEDPRGGQRGDPGGYRGIDTMEILASRLTASPLT